MPTVVETPRPLAPAEPPRKKLTRAEWGVLESSGLLDQQHLELVEGELISKMGKKRPHVIVTAAVYAWLLRVYGEDYVNPEAPIDVAPEDNPTNEPEPDLIVLAKPSREIQDFNPQPGDLRLVVEVSDSSLSFDRTTKGGLYARARVAEYWVFDIQARRLLVHREPEEGRYRSITAYTEQESVAPLSAPDHHFPVAQAFSVLK